MRLTEILSVLSKIALAQPGIRTVILGDVYDLNTKKCVDYGVFAITQGAHTEDEDGFRTYDLYLYYIDRELEDNSNVLSVQSTGIEVLHNIIRTFSEDDLGIGVEGTITYQPFRQRFVDECCGVYARVSFRVPLDSSCVEEYD